MSTRDKTKQATCLVCKQKFIAKWNVGRHMYATTCSQKCRVKNWGINLSKAKQ